MPKTSALLALPLLLAPLAALPAAAVPVHCDFHQCYIEECTAPLVAGPVGQITCALAQPVWCEHPFYVLTHCDIWQICHIDGTGVVGCAAQGDGNGQASCVGVNKCSAIHTFRVAPGAGPFLNVCTTLGAGSTDPSLPTATVAQNVKVSCSISATFNT